MRPVLQSCEHLFAPKPVSDVKGKSPATQRPLPPVPAPTEVDETPLVRRRPTDKETDSKPSSSSAGAAGAEDEELASFLDEIDEAVGSAGVTPQGSTDHVGLAAFLGLPWFTLPAPSPQLVEDIESLLKDN